MVQRGDCLDQAGSDGPVTGSDQLAAGTAHHVLGDFDTIASGAAVGVHSEAMLADAAHFSGEIADAHLLGFGSGQGLARTESRKNTEGLGFRIDQFHNSYLS
jgi:hypothetical protein